MPKRKEEREGGRGSEEERCSDSWTERGDEGVRLPG